MPAFGAPSAPVLVRVTTTDAAELERVVHRAVARGVSLLEADGVDGERALGEASVSLLAGETRLAPAVCVPLGENVRDALAAACGRLGALARTGSLGPVTLDGGGLSATDVASHVPSLVAGLTAMRREVAWAALGVRGLDAAAVEELARRLRKDSAGAHELAFVRARYGLFDRAAEAGVRKVARARGLAFVAEEIDLGFGAIAAADRWASARARALDAFLAREVEPLARRHGVSRVAVALAWVLAQPGIAGAVVEVGRSDEVDRLLATLVERGRGHLDARALDALGAAAEALPFVAAEPPRLSPLAWLLGPR